MRRPPTIVLVPAVALVVGLGAGFVMAGGDDGTTDASTADVALMEPGAARPLPDPVDPFIVDPTEIVGYPDFDSAQVPPGAAIELEVGDDGTPPVVDPQTGRPVEPPTPPVLPPVEPIVGDGLAQPATPQSPIVPAPSTTLPSFGEPAFIDPCTTDEDCAGAAGVLRDDPPPATQRTLEPLSLGAPFAAAGAYAQMCDDIEGGDVPDPQVAPGARPTIAILTNQPSSLAVTGIWSDGTELEKLTMSTSTDHDRLWQEAWDGGEQARIVACLTLPLEDVRPHATGGRADLVIAVIAISAEGRTQTSGALVLTVPLDGQDPPFVDTLTITGAGERPRDDGTLVGVVQVHYAISDDVVPQVATLDAASASLFQTQALVENADCSGWAVNRQGQDRTLEANFALRTEQRTIDGRNHTVTVVDGELFLDPAVRGGWEGFVCVRLFARDRFGNEATIALRGASVRAPRTAAYDVGVRLDGVPEGWHVEAAWSTAGILWCGPAELGGDGATTGTCTTMARLAPHGIAMTLTPIDADGDRHRPASVTIPVNTSYCNPDAPIPTEIDGCDTGFVQLVEITPAEDTDGAGPVLVSVVVVRTAGVGQFLTNPSHLWRVGPVQAFRF